MRDARASEQLAATSAHLSFSTPIDFPHYACAIDLRRRAYPASVHYLRIFPARCSPVIKTDGETLKLLKDCLFR